MLLPDLRSPRSSRASSSLAAGPASLAAVALLRYYGDQDGELMATVPCYAARIRCLERSTEERFNRADFLLSQVVFDWKVDNLEELFAREGVKSVRVRPPPYDSRWIGPADVLRAVKAVRPGALAREVLPSSVFKRQRVRSVLASTPCARGCHVSQHGPRKEPATLGGRRCFVDTPSRPNYPLSALARTSSG